MNLHEFTTAQSQLEKRLRDLIGPELARFKGQTGVSVSSVSVELYGVQAISGPISHILGKVATEVDLRTLSHKVAPAIASPTEAADYIPHGWPEWMKPTQPNRICDLCMDAGCIHCHRTPLGKEQP